MKWGERERRVSEFQSFRVSGFRMIYTTNPVEALHRVMCMVTKTKGAWVNDKGLLKQLYLALKYNEKSWKRNTFNWMPIHREIIDKFGNRYAKYVILKP